MVVCTARLGWVTEKGGDVCRAQRLLRKCGSWRRAFLETQRWCNPLEKLLKAEWVGGETPGLLFLLLFQVLACKITFYWNMVGKAVAVLVSAHTAKCISHTYTYIPPFGSSFLSAGVQSIKQTPWGHTIDFTKVVYLKHSISKGMCHPVSHPPTHFFPSWYPYICSPLCVSISLQIRPSIPFFWTPHMPLTYDICFSFSEFYFLYGIL